MSIGCEEIRLVAPEAALELLDGAARAEVLTHVADCTPCRAELAELSNTADALLVVAPAVEPPAGFDGRVLARIGAERTVEVPRFRRWLVPVAAAAALVLGVFVGGAVAGDSGRDAELVAAPLVTRGGDVAGRVVLSEDEMTCMLDRAPEGVVYRVRVHTAAGVADAGTFTSRGPGWAWTTSLPVDGDDVRRVVVLDAKGAVRAEAQIS
jgi:anti-sigma factor RsiW